MSQTPDADRSSILSQWRFIRLHRITTTLSRSLGYPAAIRFATALSRAVFDLHPPIRSVIEEILLQAGCVADVERSAAVTQDVFTHIARFWTELIYLPRNLRPNHLHRVVEWSDPDAWAALSRSEQPLIFVSPYLGNPVIGTLALAGHFGSFTAAIDRLAHLAANRLWPGFLTNGKFRYEPNLRVLTLPDACSGLAEAIEHGGRLGLLTGPRAGHSGIRTSFLGADSRFAATPVRLAIRHSTRLVIWCCTRGSPPARPFKMSLIAEITPDSRSVRTVLPRFVHALERAVSMYPEQYLWTRR